MPQKPKVCIIGAESWGSAISTAVCHNVLDGDFDSRVHIYVYEELVRSNYLSEVINERHENIKYLPGIKLPQNLIAFNDLLEAAQEADILIFATPHNFVKSYCNLLAGNVKSTAYAVSLVKGLDHIKDGEIDLYSNTVANLLQIPCYSIMSANSAMEMAQGKLCEMTIGCDSDVHTAQLTALFQTDNCRVFSIDDVGGVELCNTLKHLVGLCAGFIDGLRLGDNTRVACLHLGLKEMMRFIKNFNPSTKLATFFESCGLANSVASSYGDKNVTFAKNFVTSHKTVQEIEANLLNGRKLLGPIVAGEIYEFLKKEKLQDEYPLFTIVHRICQKEVPPEAIIDILRNHPDLRNCSIAQFQREENSMQGSMTDGVLENLADTIPEKSPSTMESMMLDGVGSEILGSFKEEEEGFWKPYYQYFDIPDNSLGLNELLNQKHKSTLNAVGQIDHPLSNTGNVQLSFEMGSASKKPEISLKLNEITNSRTVKCETPTGVASSSYGSTNKSNEGPDQDANVSESNFCMAVDSSDLSDRHQPLLMSQSGTGNSNEGNPPATVGLSEIIERHVRPFNEQYKKMRKMRLDRKDRPKKRTRDAPKKDKTPKKKDTRKSKSELTSTDTCGKQNNIPEVESKTPSESPKETAQINDLNKIRYEKDSTFGMRLFDDEPNVSKLIDLMRTKENEALEQDLLKSSDPKEKLKKNKPGNEEKINGQSSEPMNIYNERGYIPNNLKLGNSKEQPSITEVQDIIAKGKGSVVDFEASQKADSIAMKYFKGPKCYLPTESNLRGMPYWPNEYPISGREQSKMGMEKEKIRLSDQTLIEPTAFDSNNDGSTKKLQSDSAKKEPGFKMDSDFIKDKRSTLTSWQKSILSEATISEEDDRHDDEKEQRQGKQHRRIKKPRMQIEDFPEDNQEFSEVFKCERAGKEPKPKPYKIDDDSRFWALGKGKSDNSVAYPEATLDMAKLQDRNPINFKSSSIESSESLDFENRYGVEIANLKPTSMDEKKSSLEHRRMAKKKNAYLKDKEAAASKINEDERMEVFNFDNPYSNEADEDSKLEHKKSSVNKELKGTTEKWSDILDADEKQEFEKYRFEETEKALRQKQKNSRDIFGYIREEAHQEDKENKFTALKSSSTERSEKPDSKDQDVDEDVPKLKLTGYENDSSNSSFDQKKSSKSANKLEHRDMLSEANESPKSSNNVENRSKETKDTRTERRFDERQKAMVSNIEKAQHGELGPEWDWLLEDDKFNENAEHKHREELKQAKSVYEEQILPISKSYSTPTAEQVKKRSLQQAVQKETSMKVKGINPINVSRKSTESNEQQFAEDQQKLKEKISKIEADMAEAEMAKKEMAKAEVEKREMSKAEMAKKEMAKEEMTKKEMAKAELSKEELELEEMAREIISKEMPKEEMPKEEMRKKELPVRAKYRREEGKITKLAKKLTKIMTKAQQAQQAKQFKKLKQNRQREQPVDYKGADPYIQDEHILPKLKLKPPPVATDQETKRRNRITVKPSFPLNPLVRKPRPPFDVSDHEFHTLHYLAPPDLLSRATLPHPARMTITYHSRPMVTHNVASNVAKLPRPALKVPPFLMRSSVWAIELGILATLLTRYRGGRK